ncbi:hypothetical protein K435DRAFT_866212 [Dendrothele bispora CBS 962.96]|uniref:Uncharacterized protein n=1 Tax=Dendrothele bispora (strain CBS 962.96) TaxID=1314807 RepID=A0A4S8LIA4_DENBC|nr:hypothetical protein K435DRAFT_866212 [Dendrothele bispora CBS 962.96]
MNASFPYPPSLSLFIGDSHADPPSHGSRFHTSDARSTSSNLESNFPSPDAGCPNCSSYRCKSDDEKFLRAVEEKEEVEEEGGLSHSKMVEHAPRTWQQRRRHSCLDNLSQEMWSTWITVQTLIGTSIPLDIPLNDENCPQCLTLHHSADLNLSNPMLALWYIIRDAGECGELGVYPDDIMREPFIFLHCKSNCEALFLTEGVLNQATLHKVDERLTGSWSNFDDGFTNSDLERHVGTNLNSIPFLWKYSLGQNEDDPHWTETQTAISKLSSSESDSVEPASWVSAVVFFTQVKIYGLGPPTANYFVEHIRGGYLDDLLEKAPLLSNTPAFKKFDKALKKSDHTC